MGAALSIIPLVGPLSTIATSALAGVAFCCTSTAASMFCKSCNCNSSIATRVGFAIIFCLNSMLAWLMKTPFMIRLIEKWSYDYIKMECTEGKCYGVLAVHRICFALSLFHFILGALLIGVNNTRDKRSAVQNGFWGPKVFLWISLIVASFFIPNEFFMFWGNYVAMIGASIFIIIGLVLLVDFAHNWSEMCLEKWEASDSNLWQFILVGSTAGLYSAAIALTGVMYAFFASSGCTLNRFFISFNLALMVIITILSIHPAVQEANPRSGLAQSAMIAAYCTYLVTSAVGNHDDGACNPWGGGAATTRTTTVIIGAIFTFLAIAYSTSRAATQSKALVGKGKKGYDTMDGYSTVPTSDSQHVLTSQPSRRDTPRYQALLAAVEAGSIPASALDEEDDDDLEDEEPTGEDRDDERSSTKYNYSWFHVIFVMGAMYVAMLLTDWNVVHDSGEGENPVYIGRSETAMWMRIVSSWISYLIYVWTLVAPLVLPGRFDD
ncbi:TMS membrane protein/tumor differentially expressed protein [Calocera viscosa TUFC12733]|uniref:TMS membrane protein/tumor differentially expressed protein n=1 Tax=Calocera viscosa (strain TUFC12733) TaxID=1330018 RepID=A0A167H1D2_CALVF|nr:TMS membrane protein/tumor differentially expressed protein [Calocera viscosa TUFC12733]